METWVSSPRYFILSSSISDKGHWTSAIGKRLTSNKENFHYRVGVRMGPIIRKMLKFSLELLPFYNFFLHKAAFCTCWENKQASAWCFWTILNVSIFALNDLDPYSAGKEEKQPEEARKGDGASGQIVRLAKKQEHGKEQWCWQWPILANFKIVCIFQNVVMLESAFYCFFACALVTKL